ncbi:carbamoyltransferase [Pajaroellobacter abortibovis]|uniref:Carbamoyltransferase n=1 Tax=Pajaroellobacter abortibovis TaxID=1882918 RepID=A0A1L6MX36_9BACT|nr:hypothetical protein BCY86_04325 [Pajaroellobacter abortibovis]
MKIIGISAFFHDSAAALIEDGTIVAAAQEERFTRKKHDASFPFHALKYILQASGSTLHQIDHIAYYEKPFLRFERLLETYLAFAPRGFSSFRTAIPLWIREKLFQKDILCKCLVSLEPDFNWKQKLLFSEHHLSHAASAFFPSPFHEAIVLTMDGVGEWATTSVALGFGSDLKIIKELHFPHSLGLLYSAFTYYTGFKVNSGEYKVMGLAPYGQPRFAPLIFEHLIDLKEDGTFRLNQNFFQYCIGLHMTNDKFHQLFGGPPRKPEEPLTQRHMDLAASVQHVTEEIILRLTRSLAQENKISNLCLAGGVALNCVANGKILRDGNFNNLWIQPASGDAGGALGAALSAYHLFHQKPRPSLIHTIDSMKGSFLGPSFDQTTIETTLNQLGAHYETLTDSDLFQITAQLLAEGKAIGWFQGRMEFGPRALGARSILADPRSPTMQSLLNLKIKFRESFRPFAPSVLREHVSHWFELDSDSPYMLLVANVSPSRCFPMTEQQQSLWGTDKLHVVRSQIPAVTHIDYSARIQTVSENTNPRYYALLQAFYKITECPILVNTSFNVRGEPIVCTPQDAFHCFMGTELDALVIGNSILLKENQNPLLRQNYKNSFTLD